MCACNFRHGHIPAAHESLGEALSHLLRRQKLSQMRDAGRGREHQRCRDVGMGSGSPATKVASPITTRDNMGKGLWVLGATGSYGRAGSGSRRGHKEADAEFPNPPVTPSYSSAPNAGPWLGALLPLAVRCWPGVSSMTTSGITAPKACWHPAVQLRRPRLKLKQADSQGGTVQGKHSRLRL